MKTIIRQLCTDVRNVSNGELVHFWSLELRKWYNPLRYIKGKTYLKKIKLI